MKAVSYIQSTPVETENMSKLASALHPLRPLVARSEHLQGSNRLRRRNRGNTEYSCVESHDMASILSYEFMCYVY